MSDIAKSTSTRPKESKVRPIQASSTRSIPEANVLNLDTNQMALHNSSMGGQAALLSHLHPAQRTAMVQRMAHTHSNAQLTQVVARAQATEAEPDTVAQEVGPPQWLLEQYGMGNSAETSTSLADSGQITRAPSVQRKMTVNEVNDPLEREADQVADQVMRMAKPSAESSPANLPSQETSGPNIQREATDDPIGGTEVDSNVANRVNGLEGGGQALPDETRTFFESRMGADFSDVRIHNDSSSAELSRDLNARAFTSGNNIAFDSGEYNPNTAEGKHLLAHELTHTVQQTGNVQRTEAIEQDPPCIEDVKSLHIEDHPKYDIAGSTQTLQKKKEVLDAQLDKAIEEVQPYADKKAKWAVTKLETLQDLRCKSIDELVALDASKIKYSSGAIRDIQAAYKQIESRKLALKTAIEQWHRYDDVFDSAEVRDILSSKCFDPTDLKALVGQESQDLTINDRAGDIAGIAQMSKAAVVEVGHKAEERLDDKKAIAIAAKVLIKKCDLLESSLDTPVPGGADYKAFVFASYNAGQRTIAVAAKMAQDMDRDATQWASLIEGGNASPLWKAINKVKPGGKTGSEKYPETTGYVERIFERLGG